MDLVQDGRVHDKFGVVLRFEPIHLFLLSFTLSLSPVDSALCLREHVRGKLTNHDRSRYITEEGRKEKRRKPAGAPNGWFRFASPYVS